MSLVKRIVQVPLDGGQSEEQHPFATDQPSNLEVTNARFLQGGAIGKRFGVELAPSLTNSTPNWLLEGGLHTVAEHSGRLVAVTHDGAMIEDETIGRWERLGATGPRPSQIKTDPVVRGNNSARHSDVALLTDVGPDKVTISCTVWHDSEADVCMYAWHEIPEDGRPPQLLYGPKQFAVVSSTLSLYRCPRVAQSNGKFMVIATDLAGTNLNGCFADPASSYDFSTPGLVDAALSGMSTATIELVGGPAGDVGYWAMLPVGPAQWKISKHAHGVLPASASQTAAGRCLHMAYIDDQFKGGVLVAATAAGGIGWTTSLLVNPITIVALVTPTATTQVHAATVAQASINGDVLVAWSGVGNIDPDAGATGNFGVDIAYLNRTAYAGVWQALVGQCRLGGHASWDGTDRLPVIPFVNDQAFPGQLIPGGAALLPFRSGYLGRPVLNSAGTYQIAQVGSYGIDVASLWRSYWDLPYLVTAGEKYHTMPGMEYAAGLRVMAYPVLTDESDPFDVTMGIDMLRVADVDSPALRNVSAQGTRLFQSGAGLSYVDGMYAAEVTPPPPVTVIAVSTNHPTLPAYGASSPSSGPGSPASTLYVSFAIRWTDAQGNVHRSIPSGEHALTWWVLDGGFYFPQWWILPRPFPCSVLGDKASQHYEVEVYQADAADGTMYLRGTCTPTPHPSLDAFDAFYPVTTGFLATSGQDAVSIVTQPSSADTITRWTDLGELQHVAPPPLVDVCSTQARIWALSAENGRLQVWPSKLLTNGFAPEFPSEFIQTIPAEGGECTALAALDDKIVVFKERAIFVLFGDPGDNTGARSTIQRARLISSDVGCSNPRSVVEGPFGVAFQASSESASGRAGVHVLSRDLQLTYPGAAVKETVAGVTFQSGTLVSPEKEVRWIMDSGKVLVWSYDVGKWSTYTERAVGSSTVRRGQYAAKVTDNTILVDLNGWNVTSTHSMQIVTPWIKVAGLQGFQRCWSSTHLFRRYGSHLKIEIAYDYSGTWNVLDAHTYSTSKLGALEDATSGRVQVMLHHRIQKCESFRFRVTEDTSNDDGSQGLEYLGCTVEVGVKKGSFRKALPPAASS